jgi:hypothetical protein
MVLIATLGQLYATEQATPSTSGQEKLKTHPQIVIHSHNFEFQLVLKGFEV